MRRGRPFFLRVVKGRFCWDVVGLDVFRHDREGQIGLTTDLIGGFQGLYVSGHRGARKGLVPQIPPRKGGSMAATETAARRGRMASYSETRLARGDETKNALKTTEFFAMVAVNAAILIAAWVSDSLDDVRAWTLVAAVAIGYMISRGLAKSGSKYVGGEDPLNRSDQ
jgi:hypothetical protein